jgi:hypothetical protein
VNANAVDYFYSRNKWQNLPARISNIYCKKENFAIFVHHGETALNTQRIGE